MEPQYDIVIDSSTSHTGGNLIGLTPNGDIAIYNPDRDRYAVGHMTYNRAITPRSPCVTSKEAVRVRKAVEIAQGILADLRNAPQIIADALEEAGANVNVRGLREQSLTDVEIYEWLAQIAER